MRREKRDWNDGNDEKKLVEAGAGATAGISPPPEPSTTSSAVDSSAATCWSTGAVSGAFWTGDSDTGTAWGWSAAAVWIGVWAAITK